MWMNRPNIWPKCVNVTTIRERNKKEPTGTKLNLHNNYPGRNIDVSEYENMANMGNFYSIYCLEGHIL